MQPLSQEDIDFVSALVHKAGLLALSMRDNIEVQQKTSPEDQVTSADLAISVLIKSQLVSRFPNDIVISEEDMEHGFKSEKSRVWLIDPIDGTQNYIMDHDDFCVMVGLLVDRIPAYGWVLGPQTGKLYAGGPAYGATVQDVLGSDMETSKLSLAQNIADLPSISLDQKARVVMGSRDRRSNPWVMELEQVSLIKTGSIGLKVARILEDRADIFAHLSGKLKTWDTAGPAAIAMGAGLDVGCLEFDNLEFPLPEIRQACTVVMGRQGAIAWCRKNLSTYFDR